MNEIIRQLSIDKTILWSTFLSLGILLLSVVIVLVFYRTLPPLVPIFNQLPWGIERLAAKPTLFMPIVLALIILVGNTTLTKYIYDKMVINARILAMTTLLISVLTFIFITRTIQIIL